VSTQLAIRPASDSPIVSCDVIDNWLRGRNEHTARNYRGDLKDFAGFVHAPNSESAVTMLLLSTPRAANAIAKDYRTDMQERGLASATIRRRLAALRMLVDTAAEMGLVLWSLKVKPPRREKRRDMSGPTDQEWFKLRETARAKAEPGSVENPAKVDPVHFRNLALLLLLNDRGLRRGECVGLDLHHVALDGNKPGVWVKEKGKTERTWITIPLLAARAVVPSDRSCSSQTHQSGQPRRSHGRASHDGRVSPYHGKEAG
jgi:site-specific recombinase XerD